VVTFFGAALSEDEQARIDAWIKEGAENN